MEPQLASLIRLQTVNTLVHEWFLHEYDNRREPIWALVTGVKQDTGRVFVRDHTGYELPESIDPAELCVGLRNRLANESLIRKFIAEGLGPMEPFLIPDPPPQAPPPREPTPASPRPPPAPAAAANRQKVIDVNLGNAGAANLSPAAAFLSAITPRAETLGLASAAKFERALLQFVQKGSLVNDMETVLLEINGKDVTRNWITKANYLMTVYKEGDAKASHLQSAIYFYATGIHFLSPDLEWLANQFISEMKAKVEAAGPDSSSWEDNVELDLENQIRQAYYLYKSRGLHTISKKDARPRQFGANNK
jgi:hypothetical protein